MHSQSSHQSFLLIAICSVHHQETLVSLKIHEINLDVLLVVKKEPTGPLIHLVNQLMYPIGKLINVLNLNLPSSCLTFHIRRNNHIGGFIRYSIIPASAAETRENFDANAFFYHCREIPGSCVPVNLPYSRFEVAYDNAGGDNKLTCSRKINIPDWLPAGDYTLQWSYFGAGHSYGNQGEANPTYRSCHDIRITSSGKSTKPSCPLFEGGDRATLNEKRPANQCLYFHETGFPDGIYKVPNSEAASEYKFGVPLQISQCVPQPSPASTSTVWVTSTTYVTKTTSC